MPHVGVAQVGHTAFPTHGLWKSSTHRKAAQHAPFKPWLSISFDEPYTHFPFLRFVEAERFKWRTESLGLARLAPYN